MDTISLNDLRTLFEAERGPCISLYMPALRGEQEGLQNRVRLKNLLTEAEQQLLDRGVSAVEARRYLAPGRALVDDGEFWKDQSEGLVLFLGADLMRHWRLPTRFEPFVEVADRFYVKPLWPFTRRDTNYYILAFSQNVVRLFETTRWTIEEHPAELPAGIDQVLGYDEPEALVQTHSAQPALRGKQSAVFHGQGGGVDPKKAELLTYCRAIDRAVARVLHGHTQPLVFAGVGYLFSMYQTINSYPHLAPAAIEGSPDYLTPHVLRERGWAIAEPLLRAKQTEAARQFSAAVGNGLASTDIPEVVQASCEGRLATLFVSDSGQLWGRVDPATHRVDLLDGRQPDAVELLNLAARATHESRGEVFVVPADEIPGGGVLAAVLRYRVPLASPGV